MEMIDPALEGRYSNKDLIQVKHLGIIIICNFWFLGQYPAINICWFREISGGSYRGYVCTNWSRLSTSDYGRCPVIDAADQG